MQDLAAMELALTEAKAALSHSDVPVGAVIIFDGEVIASRHNERELRNDPCAHAETLVLQDAAKKLGRWRLANCTLVVTLEPCLACAGAMINARLGRLVFGAADLKAGACGSLYNLCADPRLNHEITVQQGILREESTLLLQEFFSARR